MPLGVDEGLKEYVRGHLITMTITIRCCALMVGEGVPLEANICQRVNGSLLVDFDPVAFLGS